jgi:hypothetical protein
MWLYINTAARGCSYLHSNIIYDQHDRGDADANEDSIAKYEYECSSIPETDHVEIQEETTCF